MTEQKKALSLVNMLRFNAPRADAVPAGIRSAYTALLAAYKGLSAAEQSRVLFRAQYDAAPADQRIVLFADPDLLVEAHHGATQEARLTAAKSIRGARKAAQAVEIGGPH